MNYLAIETSSPAVSVALSFAGVESELCACTDQAGPASSEQTLPLIHRLLATAGASLQEIDVVVFGQGPGAFTGVRIACGIAQGLAFGLGKPIMGIPTTLVLAEMSARTGPDGMTYLVAIDARMDEVYLACYQQDLASPSGWCEQIAPVLCGAQNLPEFNLSDMAAIGSGFGHPLLGSAILARYGIHPQRVIASPTPSALALLRVAARMHAASGDAVLLHAREAAPLYLRNKVALTVSERDAKKRVARV